ncbi:MAG: hypothetical protein ACJAYU_003559 [Bradymonadia bacterium]
MTLADSFGFEGDGAAVMNESPVSLTMLERTEVLLVDSSEARR